MPARRRRAPTGLTAAWRLKTALCKARQEAHMEEGEAKAARRELQEAAELRQAEDGALRSELSEALDKLRRGENSARLESLASTERRGRKLVAPVVAHGSADVGPEQGAGRSTIRDDAGNDARAEWNGEIASPGQWSGGSGGWMRGASQRNESRWHSGGWRRSQWRSVAP